MLQEYLSGIVRVATSFVGSHYVHGGCGNRPGMGGGHPRYKNRVRMLPDVLNPPDLHHHNPPHQRIFTAGCESDRLAVCPGRHLVEHFPKKKVPIETLRNASALQLAMLDPQKALWPRQFGGTTVFGEACTDIHHFDCVGFVNFCIFRTTGLSSHHPSILQIWQWQANQRHAERLTRDQIQLGDLLLLKHDHITIAISRFENVHAKSEQWGVCRERINMQNPIVVRPTEAFFASLYR